MFDYAAHGLIESAVKRDLPGAGAQTIGAVLDGQLQRDPHQLALVGRSARYSYAELDAQVARAAAVFFAHGIRRYDRIAACLPNDVDIVVALLACAHLGAIWVGVNRPLAPPEKVFILQDSGASLYLTDAAGLAEIGPLRAQLPALRTVLCIAANAVDKGAHSGSDNDTDNDTPGEAHKDWRTLLDAAAPDSVPAILVDSFEPAAIAYTSGTTGRPKGAVHSHHNVLLPGAIKAHQGYFAPDCVQGVMLPLTILNLMVLAPMVAFQNGSCCVCMDSVKPEDIARWVREERVGHFASVPTVIQDLLTSEQVNPADLVTLGQPDIGGAGIAQSFQQLYAERFGRRMTVAYGMTEAPTIVTRTSGDGELQEELCGSAVEQVDILIVDEDDNVLPSNAIGQICVAPATNGPYARVYTTMLGYWNRPQATAAALRNGRYHTGDVGYLDAQGQLFIRGRQNDLIIRGGANVYPVEVERVLGEHPAVSAVAVLGIADERLGQRVAAVIELSEVAAAVPAGELVQSLKDHCAAQLARYKVPEHFRCVDCLPRNAMNKIVKPQLVYLF